MKKLDKLLISSFLGPFFITFFVVVFILLTVFMLKYFDDIVGKGLGVGIISQLIFYFSINMTTNALPLAVLLSSLMTFGNLGVHFELIAIKSSGVSLLRVMQPLFLITCFLVVLGFYNNNYLVPKANLEAFSLLYDIKQKKPALDIKQGVFYNSLPGYSIKISERLPDGETIKDVVIYEHAGGRGNKTVTLADSGKMYNILDSRYLVLELFDGNVYDEQQAQRKRRYRKEKIANPYLRASFEQSKMVIDLSDFDLKRTRKDLFNNNRLMKNINQLRTDLDSMFREYDESLMGFGYYSAEYFDYHQKKYLDSKRAHVVEQTKREAHLENADSLMERVVVKDSVITGKDTSTIRKTINIDSVKIAERKKGLAMRAIDSARKSRFKDISKTQVIQKENKIVQLDTAKKTVKPSVQKVTPEKSLKEETENKWVDPRSTREKLDSLISTQLVMKSSVGKALNHVRYIKGNMSTRNSQLKDMIKQIRKFDIERYKKLAMSLTILAMFLIGAPLGAIIKKGGLGMPVLFSIFFFVLFYIVSMLGEKWARQGLMSPLLGVWLANIVLFPIGFMFLYQARRDAKLFDGDFYRILFTRLRKKIKASSK